jgi:glycosyltransferase involved in cell wall biosynthesis
MEKLLTILTPTFNRAYILNKLYLSLINQTNKNFEWIIIDDGSTDNTSSIISDWIKEGIIDIKYFFQPNGGKHRAVNLGVKKSICKYIYILDSDDYLIHSAVSTIYLWLFSIDDDKHFAGISGLRGYSSEKQIGFFPKKKFYIDATNLERISKNLNGDKAEIYRREILLKFRFPEFEGEKFLSESVVWNNIAINGYKIRWFNEVIHICNYLNDGLTKTTNIQRLLNNFNGYTLYEQMNILGLRIPHKFLAIGRYVLVAQEFGLNKVQIKEKLRINTIQFFFGIILIKLHKIIRKQ